MDWPWIKNLITAVVLLLTGSAITLITNWIKSKEDGKKFDLERQDKYRLTAIEKRLEVHQKTFEYWTKLRPLAHKNYNDKQKLLEEARNFWNSNCLFMEDKTREGFDEFIYNIENYPDWREYAKSSFHNDTEKQEAKATQMNAWKQIQGFGRIIQGEINLKPFDSKAKEKQNAEGEIKQ
jgi:hypothetical protein